MNKLDPKKEKEKLEDFYYTDKNEEKSIENLKNLNILKNKSIDSNQNRFVPPHKKKSREVTDKDIERVVEEAKVLHELCFAPRGIFKGAFAVAHPQIEEKDPLRLYVTVERKIIINPVITRHNNYLVDSKEACLSYPDNGLIIVRRWHKCEIDFVTVMVDPDDKEKFKLSSVQHEKLSGFNSFVAQHEINHLEAKYIY